MDNDVKPAGKEVAEQSEQKRPPVVDDGGLKTHPRGSLPLAPPITRAQRIRATILEIISKSAGTVISLAIIILYTYIGGLIFSALEQPGEEEKITADIDNYESSLRNSTVDLLTNCSRMHSNRVGYINRTLNQLLEKVGYEIPKVEEPFVWTLWGGMYFAATLYSTVGYGSYYPVTFWGQFATIVYSLIGIPIFLILLASWGKLLFRIFKWTWVTLTKLTVKLCVCYRQRLKQHAKKLESADETVLPTWVAVVLLFGWIIFSAGIFLAIEPEWDFFKSIYFFFISLTTIGLGDVTPSTPRLGVLTFPLIWAGLAVVSMCLSIIQNNLEAFMNRIMGVVEADYVKMISEGQEGGLSLNDIKKRLKCWDRVLFEMMDDSKIHQIEKSIEKHNNQHSTMTQTPRRGVEIEVQAGTSAFGGRLASGDEDDPNQVDDLKGRAALRSGLKRSYIYNVND